METKNAKKTNEMFSENTKTNEWFNDAANAMVETYKKQMDLIFGSYNTFLNSMMATGKSNWNKASNYTNLFSFGNNSFKSLFDPLSGLRNDGESINRLSMAYEKFFRQINEYNKILLDTFQESFQLKQNDWISLNEKYQGVVEEEWNSTKNLIQTMSENFNKQLNFSMESNKQLVTELNKQLTKAMKNNQEFWAEIAKTYETPKKEETPGREEKHKYERKELTHSA